MLSLVDTGDRTTVRSIQRDSELAVVTMMKTLGLFKQHTPNPSHADVCMQKPVQCVSAVYLGAGLVVDLK